MLVVVILPRYVHLRSFPRLLGDWRVSRNVIDALKNKKRGVRINYSKLPIYYTHLYPNLARTRCTYGTSVKLCPTWDATCSVTPIRGRPVAPDCKAHQKGKQNADSLQYFRNPARYRYIAKGVCEAPVVA